jgi:hypothetical protein
VDSQIVHSGAPLTRNTLRESLAPFPNEFRIKGKQRSV